MVSRLCDDGVQGRDGRCVENSSGFQIFLFVPVCILLLGSPAGLIINHLMWIKHQVSSYFRLTTGLYVLVWHVLLGYLAALASFQAIPNSTSCPMKLAAGSSPAR